jgi:peptide/nickel transport system ATP-binding protein
MDVLPRDGVSKQGQILFEGVDLRTMDEEQLRSVRGAELAMIFQDPMTALHPVMKIGRQITDVLRLHLHLSKQSADAVAVELLRSVHIPDPERRMGEYPHQLSGGMRQRVMIAIAIACGPKLLVADEPTTALDVTVQAQILDLLEEKQQERGMAMILVSHDLTVVATRADEIAVMYGGKVVERAPSRVLFAEPRMPYTLALMRSIPRLEGPIPERLEAIPGSPPSLLDPGPGCRFAPRCAYAQQRCWVEEPPLMTGETADHVFACWFPVSLQHSGSSAVR